MLLVDDEVQKKVREVIEEVKVNKITENTKKKAVGVSNLLISQGAEGIIVGCTEISSVLQDGDLDVPVFDSTQILVEETLKKAGCELK